MIFFILGSHPNLSFAEITAVLGNQKDYSRNSSEILLVDEVEESSENLQDRLAGTIKIGDIVGEVKKFNQDEIADFIVSLLPSEGKVTFGLSVYACGGDKKRLIEETKKLGMAVKKRLKKAGQAARFVDSKEPDLSSAAIVGEKILENGGEFVLIAEADKISIGQTRTVQNFKAWSERDYGRPRRDAKSGMLPPKLARMMINLANPQNGNKTAVVGVNGHSPLQQMSILDPFCGSGTVLMEAMLMGFTNIIGSDISEKAIKDTTINLDWLKQQEGLETSVRLFNKPVETLAGDLKEKVDIIVAETYLGPPLSGKETPTRQKQIFDDLIERTASGLAALNQLLKNNGIAVLALPAFKSNKDIHYLPIKKLAEAVDLKIIPFEKGATANGGLFYARENQLIGREIVKIAKT